ncbi:MAG: hypothetical protein ACKV2Q_36400 [Planctomycetaceae bacterium]
MSSKDRKTDQWVTVQGITAAGYDVLRKACDLEFLKPPMVADEDGVMHSNPYVCKDGMRTLYVLVRMIGVGHNPMGNMTCTDYTYIFDLRNRLAQDFMSKWTGKKQGELPKGWGVLADGGATPKRVFENEKRVPLPTGDVLIVDMSHNDVIHVLSEHINKQNNALAAAQTNCMRNITKKFLAAQKLDSTMTVPVIGWQSVDRNLLNLRKAVEFGRDEDFVEAAVVAANKAGAVVETVTEREDDSEELDAATEGEFADDAPRTYDDEPVPGVDVPLSATEAKRGESVELSNARAKFRSLEGQLGTDAVNKLLTDNGIDLDAPGTGANTWNQACSIMEDAIKVKARKEQSVSGELVPGATKKGMKH